MATWDIFHSDRLEVERDLSTEAVRAGVASGAIRADDLARPAGSGAPWVRVADAPGLFPAPPAGPDLPGEGPPPTASGDSSRSFPSASFETEESVPVPDWARAIDPDAWPSPAPADLRPPAPGSVPDPTSDLGPVPPPPTAPGLSEGLDDDDELDLDADALGPVFDAQFADEDAEDEDEGHEPEPIAGADLAAEAGFRFDRQEPPTVELRRSSPVADADADEPGVEEPAPLGPEPEPFDPLDEDEEAAAFTLAADPPDQPDEIDLTAMVDVAFQLVLFFLVTATTLYFKTLEIPSPEPDDPDAVAQQMRTLDELLDQYILVEIDPAGRVSVDREPIDPAQLADRLRQVRADTLRSGMLLMADFTTPHRNAVLAVDAANAVGLQIAIAKPSAPAEIE
ncbi:biopolymer transporter ExbD [Tautonia sociabilis]|uniref:Biopolymer transporter ExbD n=1 Tax=Tautonia sociabilis TaxID=2080755 RepID=A0A432MFQ6_9BACT|nr:biopolymer transporter ExbD [Tautonia sociabilis]RUL85255.1 biopolymer transporter ExbD [Tautonia sociabilis]